MKKIVCILLALIMLVVSVWAIILNEKNKNMKETYSSQNISELKYTKDINDEFLNSFNTLWDTFKSIDVPVTNDVQLTQLTSNVSDFKNLAVSTNNSIAENVELINNYYKDSDSVNLMVYIEIAEVFEEWLQLIADCNSNWYSCQNESEKTFICRNYGVDSAVKNTDINSLQFKIISSETLSSVIEHYEGILNVPNYILISICSAAIAISLLIIGFAPQKILPLAIVIIVVMIALIIVSFLQKGSDNLTSAENSTDQPTVAENDTSNDFISDVTTQTSTTNNLRLSDTCDKVLATGTNANGDYYEIVANTTEDYTGLSIYVGVIKNNAWLLEPTKDMPFVLPENGFSTNEPETGEVYYVGNDCFVAEKRYKGSKYESSDTYMYITYNVETGKSYSTANYDWSNRREIPLIKSNDEEYMIIGADYYYSETKFNILNKRDMTVSQVVVNGRLKNFSNISEGLFSVALGESNYLSYYFYDLNGDMILDFSEYKTVGYQSVYFSKGKCNLEIINNNDTKYKLTINLDGEVTDSQPITD